MRFAKGLGMAAIVALVAGCAVFDRDVRDAAACQEIGSLDGSGPNIQAIRSEALPQASARLGRDIHDYVRLQDSLNSGRVIPTPGTAARLQSLAQDIQTRCAVVGVFSAAPSVEPDEELTNQDGVLPDNSPGDATTQGSSGAIDALSLLEELELAPENRAGYDRELFAHWIDIDGDGCNARFEVLIAESLRDLNVFGDCLLEGGEWISVYDGVVTNNPSDFDIDHLVPLAEAWDSGASEWDPERRAAFANAIDSPEALVAVSASSNRSKSDKDPAEWLPPDETYWCTYATDWVKVKSDWGLSVDPAEKSSLTQVLEGCS